MNEQYKNLTLFYLTLGFFNIPEPLHSRTLNVIVRNRLLLSCVKWQSILALPTSLDLYILWILVMMRGQSIFSAIICAVQLESCYLQDGCSIVLVSKLERIHKSDSVLMAWRWHAAKLWWKSDWMSTSEVDKFMHNKLDLEWPAMSSFIPCLPLNY